MDERQRFQSPHFESEELGAKPPVLLRSFGNETSTQKAGRMSIWNGGMPGFAYWKGAEESSAASGPGMDHVAFTIREPDFFHAVSLLKKNQVEMVRRTVFRGEEDGPSSLKIRMASCWSFLQEI